MRRLAVTRGGMAVGVGHLAVYLGCVRIVVTVGLLGIVVVTVRLRIGLGLILIRLRRLGVILGLFVRPQKMNWSDGGNGTRYGAPNPDFEEQTINRFAGIFVGGALFLSGSLLLKGSRAS